MGIWVEFLRKNWNLRCNSRVKRGKLRCNSGEKAVINPGIPAGKGKDGNFTEQIGISAGILDILGSQREFGICSQGKKGWGKREWPQVGIFGNSPLELMEFRDLGPQEEGEETEAENSWENWPIPAGIPVEIFPNP